jgi:hypothetical protein
MCGGICAPLHISKTMYTVVLFNVTENITKIHDFVKGLQKKRENNFK